jgi:hypothetical protein
LDAVRKSVRVDKFEQGQALKIDTLAVAACVALLEHPYAFLSYPRIPRRAKTTIEAEGISKVRKQTNRSSSCSRGYQYSLYGT